MEVKRGEHFTSPAIYCDNSHEYVVVINNKIIKTFQEDFAKGKRFTVNTFIHKIVYHQKSNKSYVVFEDLTISPLEDVLQNPKSTTEFANKHLKSCQLLDDSFHIISNKDGVVALTVIDVASGTSSSKTVKPEKSGEDLKLLGSCFNSNNKNLVTFFDGSVCISGDLNDQHVEIQQVKKLPVHPKTLLTVAPRGLIVSLADDIVAVVHSSPTNKNELTISAVDLLYGSVFTCHKSSTTASAQVDMFDGYLLMIANEEISKVDYSAEAVTLFSVAHCQQKATSCDNTDLYTADNFYLQAEAAQQKHLDELMGCKKNVNKMKIWTELWDSLVEMKKISLFSSGTISLLMKQLLNEEKFKLISKIINTGFLTTRISPYLLDGVLKTSDTGLLMDFLNHINDVSEQDMVKCLDHLLLSDKDVVTAKQEDILNKIISLPNTNSDVKEALTKLSYQKSEALLKFLCTILEKSETLQQDELMYKQVISWVSNLIDVNYANFITYQDSIEILVKLQQVVSLQSEYMEEFRKIELFMMTMENAKKLKSKKPQDFSYKIELMSI